MMKKIVELFNSAEMVMAILILLMLGVTYSVEAAEVTTYVQVTHVPYDASSPDDLVVDRAFCGGVYLGGDEFFCESSDLIVYDDPEGNGQWGEGTLPQFILYGVVNTWYKYCTFAYTKGQYLNSLGEKVTGLNIHCRETVLHRGGFE